MPESFWKHHKSKDRDFLHRSYTAKIFPTPKRNFLELKKIEEKNSSKNHRKNGKFQKIWKMKNLKSEKNQKSSFFNFSIFRGKKCVIFFRTFFFHEFFFKKIDGIFFKSSSPVFGESTWSGFSTITSLQKSEKSVSSYKYSLSARLQISVRC